MKIRTVDELQDAIDNDLIWRKRELAQPVKFLGLGLSTEATSYICRSSITIMYAHWEGFLKYSAEIYINFVRTRKPLQKQVIDQIRIYGSRSTIQKMKSSQSMQPNDVALLMSLLTPNQNRFEAGRTEIDTKSNLGEQQTQYLLESIGFPFDEQKFRTVDFDKKILTRRNNIAHGTYISITPSEVKIIRDDLLNDMMDIRDKIIDMAQQKLYLKEEYRSKAEH